MRAICLATLILLNVITLLVTGIGGDCSYEERGYRLKELSVGIRYVRFISALVVAGCRGSDVSARGTVRGVH
jgi:hypothetical protein